MYFCYSSSSAAPYTISKKKVRCGKNTTQKKHAIGQSIFFSSFVVTSIEYIVLSIVFYQELRRAKMLSSEDENERKKANSTPKACFIAMVFYGLDIHASSNLIGLRKDSERKIGFAMMAAALLQLYNM